LNGVIDDLPDIEREREEQALARYNLTQTNAENTPESAIETQEQ
jgi:hypothetical protein